MANMPGWKVEHHDLLPEKGYGCYYGIRCIHITREGTITLTHPDYSQSKLLLSDQKFLRAYNDAFPS